MTAAFAQFGNDLHAGRRALPIVRRRRTWYLIGVALIVVLGAIALVRGPNLGIEFTGGSEFQIARVADADQSIARDVVREHVPDNEPKITVLGTDTLRVQTSELSSDETAQLASELAGAYDVPAQNVSSSFIGPVWGADVTTKMLRGVLAFIVLTAVVMALYFRNLTTSIAAMIALVHDMLLTAAVYGVVGFEITPATVIGFLTILGYSLYDTIVVFDKVRENTAGLQGQRAHTYAEAVERAANQTVVRSINTSVVALLPVGAILAIGAFVLGAGTLKDISLALFVGILAGTYSSIFLAPGILVDLRNRERSIAAHTRSVQESRSRGEVGDLAPRPLADAAPDQGES
ncbi:protein translocase subunit SecF [Brachybacterium phenoliresistens]|uniref:Protein-export membrane protein SecF n=1 Tax=Brachybacterium phenoliresistens TaxID=396014 RepID=Z9JYQ3_9MICO|nr:protein translocase subunit SecF [Brachybacterium phenoliresistens]EWS82922.1 preprotein translocase subunit SecF [Brachybacterium phenoliresistens]